MIDLLIADSSPLIALARIGRLALLPRLAQRIFVPTVVWEEITIEGGSLPGASAVIQCNWLEIMVPPAHLVESLSILVDRGEATAIALAQTIPSTTLLIDDARGRRVAERIKLPCIGTVGLLRRAKKRGLIPLLRPEIEQLQRMNIYIRSTLVEAVLRDVGE